MNLFSLIIIYAAPLSVIILGMILIAIGLLNWYDPIKTPIVRWIAIHIYRDCHNSEVLAAGLLQTVAGFFVGLGGVIVIYGLLYFVL